MKKQMISFTEKQHSILMREAKAKGIPVAELVRRIIDTNHNRHFSISCDVIEYDETSKSYSVMMVIPGGCVTGFIKYKDLEECKAGRWTK